jgi:hypothetical protein
MMLGNGETIDLTAMETIEPPIVEPTKRGRQVDYEESDSEDDGKPDEEEDVYQDDDEEVKDEPIRLEDADEVGTGLKRPSNASTPSKVKRQKTGIRMAKTSVRGKSFTYDLSHRESFSILP